MTNTLSVIFPLYNEEKRLHFTFKDILKFNWFSQGYLAYDNEKDLIIDVRYSAIPNEAEGLWGIKINPDPKYTDHI